MVAQERQAAEWSAAEAHRDSTHHRDTLREVGQGCCFYCLRRFGVMAVARWIDDGATALCPHCGIDAVLPDRGDLPEERLAAMHHLYFGRAPWPV